VASLYRTAPSQKGLGVESDQHQWAHSASCVVVMAWISANRWYILSTPSVVSRREVLGGLAMAASVCPPSQMAEGATSLTRAWVEIKPTIRTLSASTAGSSHGDTCRWAVVATSLLMSLLHRCAASYSALDCRARACARCPS
jgi:hypothetical protein